MDYIIKEFTFNVLGQKATPLYRGDCPIALTPINYKVLPRKYPMIAVNLP